GLDSGAAACLAKPVKPDELLAVIRAALRQAGPMRPEAIGQIVHRLNSTLQLISGYRELLLRAIHPADSLRPPVAQLKKAGDRAAALVSQLAPAGRPPPAR